MKNYIGIINDISNKTITFNITTSFSMFSCGVDKTSSPYDIFEISNENLSSLRTFLNEIEAKNHDKTT